MKKIEWHIEKRPIADLKDAEYNPRRMTEQEERDLEESIDQFGTVNPGAVNIGSRENVLIGGHQRRRIYLKRGHTEMDVMVPSRELTTKEERSLNLRLNKNTGSWDFEKLKDMGLGTLLDVGFGDDELSPMFNDVDVLEDEYPVGRAIKDIKTPKVRTGEVWKLGEHRLMCATPTQENVATLMKEDLATLAYLDLPKTLLVKKDKSADVVTKLTDPLIAVLTRTKANAHVLHWIESKYIGLLQMVFADLEVAEKRLCTWIKNNAALTPKTAFNKTCEHILYGTRGNPSLNPAYKNLTEILNKEVGADNQMQEDVLDLLDLWVVKQKNVPGEYSKPVTLHERPLKRLTSPGDIVLDAYGEAGTVLVACEQLRRKARVLESDPVLCTIIIDRWEALTDLKAKKV
jgi:hypothetical protein